MIVAAGQNDSRHHDLILARFGHVEPAAQQYDFISCCTGSKLQVTMFKPTRHSAPFALWRQRRVCAVWKPNAKTKVLEYSCSHKVGGGVADVLDYAIQVDWLPGVE